ncbi:MAG: hypothetical protein RMJ56_11535 [Gemmataceae bacterium]|nr:hypothetical protein [Gemmata sp.]MDW8198223.1 hypothetical protein [Gemmataceae bacterium]
MTPDDQLARQPPFQLPLVTQTNAQQENAPMVAPEVIMKGTLLGWIFTLGLLCSAVAAAEPCHSGLPVGQRPGPYSFLVATGPQRGQQTCYICEQHDENKPGVIVFARSLNSTLGKLLSQLESALQPHKNSGCKVWMTLLTDKADLDALAKWAQQQGLKACPVGVFEDADGPPSYKLNKEADVTVIFFTQQKVVANFAFRPGELDATAIETVMKSVPRLFDKK